MKEQRTNAFQKYDQRMQVINFMVDKINKE